MFLPSTVAFWAIRHYAFDNSSLKSCQSSDIARSSCNRNPIRKNDTHRGAATGYSSNDSVGGVHLQV